MTDIRVILIGGTSHTGKSTLARHLAQRSGWMCISTDRLGRHPGRPWGEVGTRPQVRKYYLEFSDRERLRSVLVQYGNMWPLIEGLVRKHATDRTVPRLVLEGSALLPENIALVRTREVVAICLTASETLFRSRIYEESAYEQQEMQQRRMIDAFVARTGNFDRAMMSSVQKLNLPLLTVQKSAGIEELARECLEKMGVPT